MLYYFYKGKYSISVDDFISIQYYKFDANQFETIANVLEYYGIKETYWFSDLTHKEAPWLIARAKAGVAPGECCNDVITLENMQQYYEGIQ